MELSYYDAEPRKSETFITWIYDELAEYPWVKVRQPNVTGEALDIWFRISNEEDKIMYEREMEACIKYIKDEIKEINKSMKLTKDISWIEKDRLDWEKLRADIHGVNYESNPIKRSLARKVF